MTYWWFLSFYCVLIISCAEAGSSEETECEDNEMLVDCPTDCIQDYCPKSEEEALLSCPQPPEPRTCPPPECKCRFNHRRAENGTCIPTRSCPPFECCRPNEEFNPCPPYCPSDDCSQASPSGQCPRLFGVIRILLICQPKCRCKKNYWRKNGICVPYDECNKESCSDKPNEEYFQEKSTCPPDVCKSLVARYICDDAPASKPGCACKSGYLRLNEYSPCIPICDCPEMANSPDCKPPEPTCDCPNEEWVKEKSTCPPDVCKSLVARYNCDDAPAPKPGCACKSGYLRLNEFSPCIPICDCPEMANSPDCKPPEPTCDCPNEEWVEEKSTCPPDVCKSLVERYDCDDAPPPKPGCACKSGYLRLNEFSPCIPICDCPEMANSPDCKPPEPTCDCPNEEWVEEKSTCPPDVCKSLVARYDCDDAPPPKPGCACKSGYLRLNEFSPCIPICDCPEMANSPDCKPPEPTCDCPNEEWVEEKSTCPPDVCKSLVARYNCDDAPAPMPGCACKSGYLRLNESSPCIPICDCPEMANSADCKPPEPTCGCPNEEWVEKKRSCPPETCFSTIAWFDCTNATLPKPGCACKSGFLRLDEKSPCIPTCQCPQLSNSLECRRKDCNNRNEEWVDENMTCPPQECNSLVARIDCRNAPPPQPGCACKSGFTRLNASSECVPVCDCPQMKYAPACQTEPPVPELSCGFHEVEACVQSCPPEKTCRNKEIQFSCIYSQKPCTKKCVCEAGYFRNSIGECITEAQCDQCSAPNEFYSCNSACDNECINIETQNRTHCPILNIVCNKRCYCDDGYARDSNGNCIPVSQCPSSCNSPYEFIKYGRTCPPDLCMSTVAKFKCDTKSRYHCSCKPGYLRLRAGSPCIPICQCPEMINSPDCASKPRC